MENLFGNEMAIKKCRPHPFLKFYYTVRPTIPRRLQILARRKFSEAVKYRNRSSWPISESAAAVPADWDGWKDGKQFALILTHDIENQKGYDKHRKLMEIEKEMGFVSLFNFVPERYRIDDRDLQDLKQEGFEVGVHGLHHDGKLLQSEKIFMQRARRINEYIRKWGACGFRAPSMHHDLELFKHLDIKYDLSTFDTDPFEPQSDGMNTIFPFYILKDRDKICYWELPYTLPQDNTLFIILQEKSAEIWIRKTDWIAQNKGMVLINVHPDYINFGSRNPGFEEYPVQYYRDFLSHIRERYDGMFWNPLPRELVSHLNEVYRDRPKKIEPLNETSPVRKAYN